MHRENDREYALFVCNLAEELFGIRPSVYYPRTERHQHEVSLVVSRTDLIEFLEEKGLARGNKVVRQAGVPNWIKNDIGFSKATLRGLIDTDGGIYFHKHTVCGNKYFNIGLTFTNSSIPLLIFVEKILLELDFSPKMSHRRKDVFLYREAEVIRYIKMIGFHNPHHLRRVEHFLAKKKGGVRRIG